MTVSVLYLFLAVPWIGLQWAIVEFPGHTHFLFSVLCIAALQWFIYFDNYFEGLCTVLHTVQINFLAVDVNKYRYIQTPIGLLIF